MSNRQTTRLEHCITEYRAGRALSSVLRWPLPSQTPGTLDTTAHTPCIEQEKGMSVSGYIFRSELNFNTGCRNTANIGGCYNGLFNLCWLESQRTSIVVREADVRTHTVRTSAMARQIGEIR
ncbi:hypothetical protein EVAR_57058_1 [Eumeta japonica]|uniref:Uncharacterized protein n=1 Tax=Eumeta variegata TaxID=151549 RepID=A0A4C1YRT2_EUMVA|nr:hypothetical protein EVAR_57058_1 [Eumeta japonica]